jgi:hypothetical protein
MASRKTTRRNTSGKGRKGKTTAELRMRVKKAQAEIQKLLKGDQAGSLTRANLRAGLEEIEDHLYEMEPLEGGW